MGFGDFISDAVDTVGDWFSGDTVGVADLIVPGATAGLGMLGSAMQNNAAIKEAEKNRSWQQMMSDTAHQREVADLRAAGLNPILSVSKGGMGASTPSGAVAPIADVVAPGLNTGLGVFRARNEAAGIQSLVNKQVAEILKIKEDTLNAREENLRIKAETASLEQSTMTNSALANKYLQEAKTQDSVRFLNFASARRQEMEGLLNEQQKLSEKIKTQILGQDLIVARAAAFRAHNLGEIDNTTFGKVMRYIEFFINAINPLVPKSHLSLGSK